MGYEFEIFSEAEKYGVEFLEQFKYTSVRELINYIEDKQNLDSFLHHFIVIIYFFYILGFF